MSKKKATTKTKAASKPTQESVFGVVTYRMTYLWSEPSTLSRIEKIVVRGTVVRILEELPDNWSKVETVDGLPVQGYIRSSFIGKAEG